MNDILKKICFFLPLLLITQACGLYKLQSISVPPAMKTISVQLFDNGAPLVVPTLSSQFTEALKDRIRNQTKLSLLRNEADANFEGRITDYSIKPAAIQGNNQASLLRLTITVNVKYTNSLDPKAGFDESFTRSKEFPQSPPIQAQEPGLIRDLTAQLTEDIFNRAFANW